MNINGYETDRELGRGVTSTVFRAKKDGKYFALKLMDKAGAEAVEFAQRFVKEASLLSRLNSECLVKIYELGEFESRPYVVLEFIDYGSLAQEIKKGTFSENKIVNLAKKLGAAFNVIHRIGLVHRDVKPENILFDGDAGVKLIDFGFAEAQADLNTNQFVAVGTLLYSPPEQNGSLKRKVDARSDLYSLGCILYECATGLPPYHAEDAAQLIHMHATAQPSDLTRERADLSPQLIAVINKLLSKDPDDRYQSSEGLLEDLNDLSGLKTTQTGSFELDRKALGFRTGSDSPFVGREREKAVLGTAWERAKSGTGRLIQIEGEGGSGKSRLSLEIVSEAQIGKAVVLRGKCQKNGMIPFGVIREALDDLVIRQLNPGSESNFTEQILKAAAGKENVILNLSNAFSKLVPAKQFSKEAGISDPQFNFKVASFFIEFAKLASPLLFVVDDVQWIDHNSLDVIKKIKNNFDDLPFLIMTTARNDADSNQACEKFLQEVQVDDLCRIKLGPMSRSEVSTFAHHFFGGRNISDEILDKLVALSNGNVFAVGEYLRAMSDSGVLRLVDGRWQANLEEISKLSLSADVIQILVNRIRGLRALNLEFLKAAAIVGNRFDIRLVGKVTELEAETIGDGLGEAIQASLIQRFEENLYGFTHDRVREALMSASQASEYKAINQKLSDILSLDSQAEFFGISPIVLAKFLINGNPEKNPQLSLNVFERASRLCLLAYENKDAYAFAKQCEEALTRISDSETLLQKKYLVDELLGSACLRVNRSDEARGYLQRAIAESKDSAQQARLNLLVCSSYFNEGKVALAWDSLAATLKIMKMGPPRNAWLASVKTLGLLCTVPFVWLFSNRLHFSTFQKSRSRRVAIAPTINAVLLGMNRFDLNFYYRTLCVIDSLLLPEGKDRAIGIIFLPLILAQIRTLKNNLTSLFRLLPNRFILKIANNCRNSSIRICERTGDKALADQVNFYFSSTLFFLGEDVAAFDLAREVFESQRKYASRSDAIVTANWILGFLFSWAHFRESLSFLEENEALFLGSEDGSHKTQYWGQMAAALVALGRVPEAKKLLDLVAANSAALDSSNVTGQARVIIYGMGFLIYQQDFGARWDELAKRLMNLNFYNNAHYALIMIVNVEIMRNRKKVNGATPNPEVGGQVLSDLSKRVDWIKSLGDQPRIKAYYLLLKAKIANDKGDFEFAKQLLDKVHSIAKSGENFWLEHELYMERIVLFQRQGMELEGGVAKELAHKLVQKSGWHYWIKHYEESMNVATKESRTTDYALTRVNSFKEIHNDALVAAILNICLSSSGTIDMEVQAKSSLAEVVKTLNAERGFIFFQDDETKQLAIKAGKSSDGSVLTELTGYSSTVVKKVFEEGKPLIVSSTEEGEALGSKSAIAHNLRSIMAAPLTIRGRVLGVIYVDSRVVNGLFTAQELKVLSIVASHLAISFEASQMAREEVIRREMQKELEVTGFVQRFFLPRSENVRHGRFSLWGYYQPATQSGGDWWWYDCKDEDKLHVLVADVTGHGAGSAMLTASTATLVSSYERILGNSKLSEMLNFLNERFTYFAQGNFNMTMSALELDSGKKKLQLWSAAGLSVFVMKPDGKVEIVSNVGTPVGSQEFVISAIQSDISEGDRIFVYTDGLPELEIPGNKQLKLKTLQKIFINTRKLQIENAVKHIVSELDKARAGIPLHDDVTFVLVDFLGVA